MSLTDAIALSAALDAADGKTLRQIAVGYRNLAKELEAVTPLTREGIAAVKDLIRLTNLLASDASSAADVADTRAQDTLENAA